MVKAFVGNLRVEDFFSFMREREAVRQRKARGNPYPWTKDKVLTEWKFTNVKRVHDRTSFMLKDNFYAGHEEATLEEILFNAAVARFFGTHEFAAAVGWSTDEDLKDLPLLFSWIKAVARTRLEKKERVFTGAYVVTSGGITGPKQDFVCDIVLWDLAENLKKIVDAAFAKDPRGHWQPLIEALQQVQGFGGTGFMAKETVLDLAYAGFWPEGSPVDRDTWTPVGPGSMRGAAFAAGKESGAKLGPIETRSVCLSLFEARKEHWKSDEMELPELELHDIQFQLCEFDKYHRVLSGKGTPRSRYHAPAALPATVEAYIEAAGDQP